jgi:hypothetical protein
MQSLGTPAQPKIRSEDYLYFEKEAFKRDVEDEVHKHATPDDEDEGYASSASDTRDHPNDTWVVVSVGAQPDFELLPEAPPEDGNIIEGSWDLETIADGDDHYWKYAESSALERKQRDFHAFSRLANLVDLSRDPLEAERQKEMFAMLGQVLRE